MSVTLMRNKMKNGTAKNSSNQNHGTASTTWRPWRNAKGCQETKGTVTTWPKRQQQ
jgi:hypothetical protein